MKKENRMAEDKKTAFPMLPAKHWWSLRNRFKQSMPGTVTENYLASVLGMEVGSARGNVLPYLISMGIIDEDGKTLDRAKQWRDDLEYPNVCEQILNDVYPEELRSAFPGPEIEREAVSRWFSNHTGAGTVAVRRMVGTFELLIKKDSSAEPETIANSSNKKASAKKETQPKDRKKTLVSTPSKSKSENAGPDLNINIQVHISSDATPDQIDQIFQSMAKHIYDKG
jgi:hypothetical protein